MDVLRYDPERDPFAAMNDPAVLDDTPIGTLRVIKLGRGPVVCVMRPDGVTVDRVVHRLKPGEHPTEAVYGKRAFEAEAAERIYAARDAANARLDEQRDAGISADFVRRLDDFVREHHQVGAEAVAMFLAGDDA